MKKRNPVHSVLIAEILRNISMYPGLTEDQLCRFHPEQSKIISSLLIELCRQDRLLLTDSKQYYLNKAQQMAKPFPVNQAVAVLLDFINDVEYHAVGDFPVQIFFFAKGKFYEIVYVSKGTESEFNWYLRSPTRDGSCRLIVLDSIDQAASINVPDIIGFCIVHTDDSVEYYQWEADDDHN